MAVVSAVTEAKNSKGEVSSKFSICKGVGVFDSIVTESKVNDIAVGNAIQYSVNERGDATNVEAVVSFVDGVPTVNKDVAYTDTTSSKIDYFGKVLMFRDGRVYFNDDVNGNEEVYKLPSRVVYYDERSRLGSQVSLTGSFTARLARISDVYAGIAEAVGDTIYQEIKLTSDKNNIKAIYVFIRDIDGEEPEAVVYIMKR